MQSPTYAITIALPDEAYIIAAIALTLGILITWLICTSSKKTCVAKLSAELGAEKSRVAEAKDSLREITQNLHDLRDSEAKLKQNEVALIAKLHNEQESQAHRHEMDQRFTAIEQLVKPLSATLENLEHRTDKLEKSRDVAHTSLSQQVQHIAATQQGLKKETAQLVKALGSVERSIIEAEKKAQEQQLSIPSESRNPIEPLDSITGDEAANDFSADNLVEEFEGFIAEGEGEGI